MIGNYKHLSTLPPSAFMPVSSITLCSHFRPLFISHPSENCILSDNYWKRDNIYINEKRTIKMSRQEKYTNEVRQALAYAREEARRLCFRLVNTEHLLLGLLRLN